MKVRLPGGRKQSPVGLAQGPNAQKQLHSVFTGLFLVDAVQEHSPSSKT